MWRPRNISAIPAPPPIAADLAEYYRSRNIGCVVFSVDEKLTGRPPVPNDEVAAFAAENSDIMIAFASVNPMRGERRRERSRRLIAAGGIRGFKLHPPLQKFHANDSRVSVLRSGERSASCR